MTTREKLFWGLVCLLLVYWLPPIAEKILRGMQP
jgi:hypothetical protein